MSQRRTILSLDDLEEYVDRAAALSGLPLPQEVRAGVVSSLAHTAEIARLLIEFSLPDETEGAAKFRP